MRTLYMLVCNCKCYISTNGIEMLRFADWLGATTQITTHAGEIRFLPNVIKYN